MATRCACIILKPLSLLSVEVARNSSAPIVRSRQRRRRHCGNVERHAHVCASTPRKSYFVFCIQLHPACAWAQCMQARIDSSSPVRAGGMPSLQVLDLFSLHFLYLGNAIFFPDSNLIFSRMLSLSNLCVTDCCVSMRWIPSVDSSSNGAPFANEMM